MNLPRYGSSPKHSKFLPQSGTRPMLTHGASKTFFPLAFVSSAMARPTARTICGSKLAAKAAPEGNDEAGALLTPAGPSVIFSDGMSRRGIGTVSKPVPAIIDIFSSSVNCLSRSSILFSICPLLEVCALNSTGKIESASKKIKEILIQMFFEKFI